MRHFATRVKLYEPGKCRVDERMVRRAASEEEICVGRKVEAPCFAVALSKLDEKLAAVFIAEAVDHLGDLRAPCRVALASFEKLLQSSAAGRQTPKIVEILYGQLRLLATRFGTACERDTAENAARCVWNRVVNQ